MTEVMREKSFTVYWISSENFCGFALSALKVLPLLEAFVGKTFAIHQKSTKTVKPFSRVAFVVYGNIEIKHR